MGVGMCPLMCIGGMKMASKLTFCFYLAAGLTFLTLVTQTQGQVCMNGFQCLNCSQALICVGGAPAGDPFTCPPSFYCLNTNYQVCARGACPIIFNCTAPGRFPDYSNSSQYIMCVPDSSQPSGLANITVPCPVGSTFSPISLQCVSITTTPPPTTAATTASTTAATTASTTAATTTTVATTTPIYSCTSTGRYVDARNCSIYYMCQTNPAGGFYVYRYTCPPTTVFNTATQKCTKSASCIIAG